jgi:hypothetical protein
MIRKFLQGKTQTVRWPHSLHDTPWWSKSLDQWLRTSQTQLNRRSWRWQRNLFPKCCIISGMTVGVPSPKITLLPRIRQLPHLLFGSTRLNLQCLCPVLLWGNRNARLQFVFWHLCELIGYLLLHCLLQPHCWRTETSQFHWHKIFTVPQIGHETLSTCVILSLRIQQNENV